MSVYIITDRAAGVCKIGYSQTPNKRLTMLRTSSAADLQLEAVIPGDLNCERDLHAEHSAAHVRREWFKITDAIEAMIAIFRPGKPPRVNGRATSQHPLAVWMNANDHTVTSFARSIDYDRSNLWRMLHEGARPSLDGAYKIEVATKGAVPMRVWAQAA